MARKEELSPGSIPYLAGIWGYHFGATEAPNWLPGHTKNWREEWTRGYNDAKMKDNRGGENESNY